MSVLVNGSPTEDFITPNGLKQGDALCPFLFLMVEEGLVAIMQKTVRKVCF